MTDTSTTISAIVPSKGRHDMIAGLIANLRNQNYPQEELEIIVVDDGSTPAYKFPSQNVRIIRHTQSRGAQASRNEALAAATGDVVLMLDDDIELLGTDFLREGFQALRAQDNIGAVFGRHLAKLCRGDNIRTWEEAPARPTRYSADLIPSPAPGGPLDWGPQVYFVYRQALISLGGYDGIYGLNGGHSFREESDIHARLRQAGYILWFCPQISFRHHIVETGGHGANVGKRLYWIAHNHMVFLHRYFRFWPIKAVGFLWDIVRYSWVQSRFRALPAMLRGYCAGIRNALRDQGPNKNVWLGQP